MEEKVLIEGKFSKANILAAVFGVVGVISLFLGLRLRARIYELWGSMASTDHIPFLVIGAVALVCGAVCFFWMSNCELTVTDKRVFGKAGFGKRVDLPFDMVSATATGVFKSLSVSTASGRISFWLLNNRDEVFSAVSKNLLERQGSAKAPQATIRQEMPRSEADELEKYKKLLDSGTITQEEFDAKKKQLLGL